MAKKTETNIVEIWNWLTVQLNSGALSANDQIVLVHIIAYINKNMWKPTPINSKIIAAAIGRDIRTVNNSIQKLTDLNLILPNEGGYSVGKQHNTYCGDSQSGQLPPQLSESDLDRGQINSSNAITPNVRTSTRKRKLFH